MAHVPRRIAVQHFLLYLLDKQWQDEATCRVGGLADVLCSHRFAAVLDGLVYRVLEVPTTQHPFYIVAHGTIDSWR